MFFIASSLNLVNIAKCEEWIEFCEESVEVFVLLQCKNHLILPKMKNRVSVVYLALALIIVLPCTSLKAQKNMQRYAVKNATIIYKHSGMTEGEEKVYIADYGKKEARYTELTVSAFGFSTTTRELELHLGDDYYAIDLNEKIGTKTTFSDDFELSKKEVKEYEELGKEMMEAMGFEKTGTGTILGKKCDIWEGMGTKSWIWKNIPLKTEVNMMGKSVIESVKIDISGNVPASKFRIPEGISFDETTADDESMNPQNMEDLEESLNMLKEMMGTKKKK